MDAARAAVNKLTGQRGHITTVEETVNPAVTREVIKPHRHEEATQAIDREVHQHHYHTTVQPLQDQQVLPEKHVHNILPAENREFRHDNEQETRQRLEADLAHFKNTKVVEATRTTQSAAPTVTGEHVHHHVHETVVPVVHKEIIQPEVVHTTIPIHETHIAAAQHHGLSALPMKTLDEFKRAGGTIAGGRHGTHEEYEGQPRQYNEKLSTTFDQLGLEGSSRTGGGMTGSNHGTSGYGTAGGVGAAGIAGAAAGRHHRERRGSNSSSSSSESDVSVGGTRSRRSKRGVAGLAAGKMGTTSGGDYSSGASRPLGSGTGHTGSGLTGSNHGTGSGLTGSNHGTGSGLTGNNSGTSGTGATGHKKPGLLDRLNPLKDTDGDGKKGFME